MKILILNWRDIHHPLAGGAEFMLWEHVLAWKKNGADITWIGSQFKDGKKEEIYQGIKIKRFGSHYSIHFITLFFAIQGKFSEFDIVVDCFHFLPFFTPLIFPKKKIIALIHEVAGNVWFDNIFLPLAFLGYITEPLFFHLYKDIPFITVSDSTKNELKKMGIKSKMIYIIHNGISVSKKNIYLKKTKYPSIVFLNRIAKDKGILDAIYAVNSVQKNYPNLHFVIAGKEQQKNSMNEILKKSATVKNISYKGFVSENEKWKLLQQSWVMVHPSKKEGWGLTVIEANAMGTPVIGYNVPGLSDSIKNNQTGFLTKPSPEALAEKLKYFLSNKKIQEQFQKNAKNWSKEFNWQKSTKKSWKLLVNVYKKTV